jgi:hypothetical protein
MGTSASLSVQRLSITPGTAGAISITVRNTGSVVDEFSFVPIGFPEAWFHAEPATVSLLPGGESVVALTITPPRSSTVVAGDTDVAVKIASREDEAGSTVEEFLLSIEPFMQTSADLVPQTQRGARRGKSEIALDNRGNTLLNATFTATDPNETLRIDIDPPALGVQPGRAAFSNITVTPEKTFWRGPDRSHPYSVIVEPNGDRPMTLAGTYIQRAKLPKWFFKALMLLLALLLLLFVFWQLALKPVVRSAAREASKDNTEQVANDAATKALVAAGIVAPAGGPTTTKAGGDGTSPSDGGKTTTTVKGKGPGADGSDVGTGGTGPDAVGAAAASGPLGAPTDKRIEVSAEPGAKNSGAWDAPAADKQIFSLTDMVLQNPQGDSGRLVVKRGDDVLFETGLENFRDLDFHYVAPYVFLAKQKLTVEVTCNNPAGSAACKAAVSIVGYVKAG